MLRRPATNEILSLIPEMVKVGAVDGLTYIGGMPGLKPDYVKSCQLLCYTAGTPKKVTICPAIPDTCECPYEWPVTVRTKPDLYQYETDQTFSKEFPFEASNADGSTPSVAQVIVQTVDFYNGNPASPVTAIRSDSDGTPNVSGVCFTLIGKTNGDTFDAYTPSGTVAKVAGSGVEDVLPPTKVYKLYPMLLGSFAELPPKTFCGNYCLLYARLCIPGCDAAIADSYDISMDRAPQSTEIPLMIAIPKSFLTPTTPEEETMLAQLINIFPCLIGAPVPAPVPAPVLFDLEDVTLLCESGEGNLSSLTLTSDASIAGGPAELQYFDTVDGVWKPLVTVTISAGPQTSEVIHFAYNESLTVGSSYFFRVAFGTQLSDVWGPFTAPNCA